LYKTNLNKYLIDEINNVMFMNIFVHKLVSIPSVFLYQYMEVLNHSKIN